MNTADSKQCFNRGDFFKKILLRAWLHQFRGWVKRMLFSAVNCSNVINGIILKYCVLVDMDCDFENFRRPFCSYVTTGSGWEREFSTNYLGMRGKCDFQWS